MPEEFSFGNIVKVAATDETAARKLAGAEGMVVGARPKPGLLTEVEIVGGGPPDEAVLVSLDEPEETFWFAPVLLTVIGQDGFVIIDEVGETGEAHGVSFGDDVQIAETPETLTLGFAGLNGVVYGLTTPSDSGVTDIVGQPSEDFAVNVWFEERNEQRWFAADLVHRVSSAADEP